LTHTRRNELRKDGRRADLIAEKCEKSYFKRRVQYRIGRVPQRGGGVGEVVWELSGSRARVTCLKKISSIK